ncbi:MAG: DUF624 domain-containing protein [Eubacteriales bacterium]|nr:DUF624 domain-containing protein [Eubacteriales bacterium]
MFGKFMNNFYYGKSGKGDYRKEDLPTTRWALFWEMLKIRFSGLMRLNLIYVVAWLPALLVALSAVLNVYSGLVSLSDMQQQVAEGAMTAEVFAQNQQLLLDGIKAIALRTLLFLVPCIAITGPCTAGASYVTRNWARDEHAFVWSDFKDAVKDNWKQALAVSAITSVMPLILYVCWAFYGEMTQQSMFFVVPQVLSGMVVLLWMMSLLYTYPLMVTYKLRFRDLMRNAFILAIGRLPMTVGLKLLSLVPTLIALLVSYFTPYAQWAVLVWAAYYLLIGYSLSRFVYASYANAAFDRYINPNIEGAEVGRGLYHDEDADDDDDEDDDAPAPHSGDASDAPADVWPPVLPQDHDQSKQG